MKALLRWLKPLLGLAVMAVFVHLISRQLDWNEVFELLAGVGIWPILLGLALLSVDMFLRATRWWLMVRALRADVPLGDCIRPFLVSMALNNVLPLRGGDVVRVVAFREHLGVGGAGLLGTMVLERLFDLLVLLGLFFVFAIGVSSDLLPATSIRVAASVALAGGGFVLVLVTVPSVIMGPLSWLLRVLGLDQHPLGQRVASMAAGFLDSLSMTRSPRLIGQLLGISVLAWLAEGGMFMSAGWAFGVFDPGPWFALSTATLATLLPSVPGHFGPFDYFGILGLRAYGVEPAVAGAIIALAHLLLWLPLTMVGLGYLLAPRLRGGRSGS